MCVCVCVCEQDSWFFYKPLPLSVRSAKHPQNLTFLSTSQQNSHPVCTTHPNRKATSVSSKRRLALLSLITESTNSLAASDNYKKGKDFFVPSINFSGTVQLMELLAVSTIRACERAI